jgi:hypothetical protein
MVALAGYRVKKAFEKSSNAAVAYLVETSIKIISRSLPITYTTGT